MICPKCREEYRDGFTRCSDCDVELVDALPGPKEPSRRPMHPSATLPEPRSDPPERFELTTVLSTMDRGRLAVAQSLLRSAGVPFVCEVDDIVDLFGWGRLGGCNPITGLPRLRVAPQDADDARALLADLGEADGGGDTDDRDTDGGVAVRGARASPSAGRPDAHCGDDRHGVNDDLGILE